jgi:hypothetical protein
MSEHPSRHKTSATPAGARVATPDARVAISLHRSSNGVVVGRLEASARNLRVDCWCLLASSQEFQRCCDLDPLRFDSPMTCVQLTREFHDVFNQPAPIDPVVGSRPDTGLLDPRAALIVASESLRLMRSDSRVRSAEDSAMPGADRSVIDSADWSRAVARAARTRSDGEMPRARACSNSAALKPRKSTLMRSRDVRAMNS